MALLTGYSRLRRGLVNTTIMYGRVMAVHPDEYSVDVQTEYLGQFLERIAYMVPYAHHSNGEGIYFIPEVGAWCWVCLPTDHNRPFVLGFMPPFSFIDDHRANRIDLKSGDLAFLARELNGVIVRRGGIVQVMATPVCQRIYSPIANIIRDICENYELNTAAGRLRWSVQRNTKDEQSRSPSELVLEAREFAQDAPVISVRLGSVETPESEPTKGPRLTKGRKIYVDLEVKGKFRYRINLDGEVLLVQEGRRSIRVKADEIQVIDGDRELTVKGNEIREIEGSSTRKYDSEDIRVKGTSRERAGRKEIIAREVFIGEVAGAVSTILGPKMLTWLKGHFHPTPTGPSGPPVQAGQLVPSLYLTKNLKVK